jgi:transcriptional regulator with XRE-family HTH domain
MATIGRMWTNIDRALPALRLRKGLSQQALGERVGVSRELISRAERGAVSGMTLGRIDRIAGALGASVHVMIRWQGEQLDRLMDATHAALQQAVASLLTSLGWEVRVEISFNHFGDRGRIDLVAYQPSVRILLIIEIKSALGDIQDTLGRLDVKVRLARQVARDLCWSDVVAVVPALVIGDSRLARRTVGAHDALFARYSVRGRTALAWLRRPVQPIPTGLLWFTNRPGSHQVPIRRHRRAPRRPDSHVA